MIIGNCTYSVRDYLRSGEMSLLDFPEFCAGLDIRSLEYNDMFFERWDNAYLADIVRSAEDAGCTIQCLTCGGNLASDDAAANREQVELFRTRLEQAAALGAPVVRFNIGSTGDEERDLTVGVERVIEGFNALLPAAREHNVKITIENHGGVSRFADPILRIVLGTDPEWVGTCPDFGNFHGDDMYLQLAKVIPFSYHMHAKFHEFDEHGEDTGYSIERVLNICKACGTQSVLSIEFEGSGDQKEGVRKSRDLLLRYL